MKYVVFDNGCEEIAVCFPDNITHRAIVDGVKTDKALIAISAGFYTIGRMLPVCYGKSDSTGLQSRPEDSLVLAKLLL